MLGQGRRNVLFFLERAGGATLSEELARMADVVVVPTVGDASFDRRVCGQSRTD